MTRSGFAHEAAPVSEMVFPRPFWEQEFGLFDPANASKNGYHIGEFTKPSGGHPPSNDPPTTGLCTGRTHLGYPITDIVTGVSVGSLERSGGCLGAAIEKIFGTFDARVRYVSVQSTLVRIGVELLDRVRASPEMQSLNQQWSECMRQNGWDFPDPFAPSSYPWSELAPSDQKPAAAGADVTCKQTVGYLAAAQRLVSDEARPARRQSQA